MAVSAYQPPLLDDLKLLCAVVDRGSFSAAAQHGGTSQPRVSRAIARLEERLDVPLVRRNSRGVAVTPEGARYAAYARHMLATLQVFESELMGADAGPLRVSAPPALAHKLLLPHFATFCRAHPEVGFELSLGARRVDLIEEEVDVAIRFGPLEPTWRRSRRVLSGRYHVYAAPALGLPPVRHPAELSGVPALVLHATHLRDTWALKVRGEVTHISVKPHLLSDDVGALIRFAVAGLGVTMLPDFLVDEEVSEGALVRLTSDAQALPTRVFAVTTSPSKRASRLVAHLAKQLSGRDR